MKRVLTAVVAIPLVVIITIYFPDWAFALVVGLVAALAVEEFLSLGGRKGIGRPGRWFFAAAAAVAISFMGGLGSVAIALAFATIALMTVTIFSEPIETALGRV